MKKGIGGVFAKINCFFRGSDPGGGNNSYSLMNQDQNAMRMPPKRKSAHGLHDRRRGSSTGSVNACSPHTLNLSALDASQNQSSSEKVKLGASCLQEQIFMAVQNRNQVLLRWLILHPYGEECGPLESGVHAQSVVCVVDRNGVNPVELACVLGYTEEVRLFLDNGCSPNLPTSTGRLIHTVLECLKSNVISRIEGYQLLTHMCQLGCDVRMKAHKSKSPLLYAAELGDSSVLKLLLTYGDAYGIAEKDPYSGFTPLHMCAMKGNLDCLKLILMYGPSSQVNITDNQDRTALVLALINMHHDLSYLDTSAESSTTNLINRETYILHQYNAIAVVEALLTAGTDPNIGKALYYGLKLAITDEHHRRSFSEANTRPELLSSLFKLLQNIHTFALFEKLDKTDDELSKENWVSPYVGIVRLLLFSGARPGPWVIRVGVSPTIVKLIDEIRLFWANYDNTKPHPLLHLCKHRIRQSLARQQRLHKIDELQLPAMLTDYLKLKVL